jgi:hypothetical protein
MATIVIEYCNSWGYGPAARDLGKAIEQALKIKVEVVESKTKSGKIEVAWMADERSNAFRNCRKDNRVERE